MWINLTGRPQNLTARNQIQPARKPLSQRDHLQYAAGVLPDLIIFTSLWALNFTYWASYTTAWYQLCIQMPAKNCLMQKTFHWREFDGWETKAIPPSLARGPTLQLKWTERSACLDAYLNQSKAFSYHGICNVLQDKRHKRSVLEISCLIFQHFTSH